MALWSVPLLLGHGDAIFVHIYIYLCLEVSRILVLYFYVHPHINCVGFNILLCYIEQKCVCFIYLFMCFRQGHVSVNKYM